MSASLQPITSGELRLPAPQFRPNLRPTWDVRRDVLTALALGSRPQSADELTALLTPGRPNEDDLFTVRAALRWLGQVRCAASFGRRQKTGDWGATKYVITPEGHARLAGPDSFFL